MDPKKLKPYYSVAIPSYKRHTVLPRKTLQTLLDGGIPADRIHIFVASEDEKALYKEALTPGTYRELVVGVPGLAAQRQFIQQHFPEGRFIVMMDDDITSVKALKDGRLEKQTDLLSLFRECFKTMERVGSNIWGVYAAASALYMSHGITTDLCYLMGGLYGIRNLNNDAYRLQFGSNQEDKERTLRYWTTDGVILRFNNITITTSNYAEGGMMAENTDRKAATKEGTDAIVAAFPGLVKQIYKDKHNIYDLRFNRVHRPPSEDQKVEVLPLRNTGRYILARENLLRALQDCLLPGILKSRVCKTTGKYIRNRSDTIGDIGRTQNFGIGKTRSAKCAEMRSNRTMPDVFKALVAFGNEIVPEGWKYNFITLNQGVKAKKHIDAMNCGASVIIGIGDYEGGGLFVYDPAGLSRDCYNIQNTPTMFNGAVLPHETDDFTGTRWSIIYFSQMAATIPGVTMMGGAEPFLATQSSDALQSGSSGEGVQGDRRSGEGIQSQADDKVYGAATAEGAVCV